MNKQQYIILSDDTDGKKAMPVLSQEEEKAIDNIIKKAIKENTPKQ